MQEQSLQAQLAESKAEVARLRDRLSVGVPTVHKDLSLVSLVPRWTGTESASPLEEFLNSIDSAAELGRWSAQDCVRVATLKIAGAARSFYNTCSELHSVDVAWDTFKRVFRHRFRDARTDQFHFLRLQTARQGKDEGPQEFADRCRALAHKVMRRDSDPVVQRVHEENTDRMLLASFVGGLAGEVGKLTRIQNPQNLEQALNAALAVREAIRQERRPETFYTHSGKPSQDSRNRHKHECRSQWGNQRKKSRDETYAHSPEKQGYYKGYKGTRDGREFRCYECEGKGHFASECPTRVKRTQSQNPPGRRHPSGRSSRPTLPREESRSEREKDERHTSQNSGNV
jgi:hypothetical protein